MQPKGLLGLLLPQVTTSSVLPQNTAEGRLYRLLVADRSAQILTCEQAAL